MDVGVRITSGTVIETTVKIIKNKGQTTNQKSQTRLKSSEKSKKKQGQRALRTSNELYSRIPSGFT